MRFDITWKWNRNHTARVYYARVHSLTGKPREWLRIRHDRYLEMAAAGAEMIEEVQS